VIGKELPPGYDSINAFVAVRGPGGAPAFIGFVEDVFDAQETLAAHTVHADGLLIHAEVRIDDSTVMLCDAKPHCTTCGGCLSTARRVSLRATRQTNCPDGGPTLRRHLGTRTGQSTMSSRC